MTMATASCGAPLTCPRCGYANAPGDARCLRCGQVLAMPRGCSGQCTRCLIAALARPSARAEGEQKRGVERLLE